MRLIDADAMRQDWLEHGENEYVYDTNAVLDSIDAQPTIDPESLRKQGEWKHFYGNRGQCSVCGVVVSLTVRNNGSYCPNCGAKMKGAGEDA